jgi:hypothetical protein
MLTIASAHAESLARGCGWSCAIPTSKAVSEGELCKDTEMVGNKIETVIAIKNNRAVLQT